jgi:hypothetical protein
MSEYDRKIEEYKSVNDSQKKMQKIQEEVCTGIRPQGAVSPSPFFQ